MATVFGRVWTFLSLQTDIWERFSFLADYRIFIFGFVFALSLLAGYNVYRMYFSITFFYLFVTISTVLLKPYMAWNYVVAFFSVAGVIFTFLSYRWIRFGAVVLSAAIGAMSAYMVVLMLTGHESGWGVLIIVILAATGAGVAAFFFQVRSYVFLLLSSEGSD